MSEAAPTPDKKHSHTLQAPQSGTNPPGNNLTAANNASSIRKPSAVTIVPGTQLGPYEILEELGAGSMGSVFKARHSRLGRLVALKVLPAEMLQHRPSVARFEREMHAAGQLQHPHVVQAFDAGDFGGIPYLAMEFVDGENLQQYVDRQGPLPISEACRLVQEAAAGLGAAHEIGLIHRDIKPLNLLVTRSGQLKILDLGLARFVQEDLHGLGLTGTGDCFGTVDYMPPEQWEDAHKCDSRTDLYALGCTLYFTLTGLPPYSGDHYPTVPSKMRGHLHASPPDLRLIRPDVPDALAVLCQKLLAKQPAKRLQSATELVDALSEWSSVAADPLRISPDKSRGTKRVATHRRNQLIAIAIGICVLGCLIFLIQGYGFVPHIRQESSPREETATGKSLESSEKADKELAPVSPKRDEIASPVSTMTTTVANSPGDVNVSPKPPAAPVDIKRTVVISSEPPGANIYVNDQMLTVKTNAEYDLAPGRYRLRIVATAFIDPPETEVLIESGEGKQVLKQVKLEPLVVYDSDYVRGTALFWGIGTQIDQAEGINCLLKAAELNHPLAMAYVAGFYQLGNHQQVSKDREEAARWAERARSRLEKLAANGDSQAQRLLGQIYSHGIGIPQNQALAVELFRKAADQNLSMAQANLGSCYEHGHGVVQDHVEAAAWFRKAADQNLALAQSNLGRMYQQGLGVTKDPVEAVVWYRKAADQNFALAQNHLGWMYQHGAGVAKDPVEAVKWYRKAADQDLPLAHNNLGSMFQHGLGVAKDLVEAVAWYRKAAEKNLPLGQSNLGWMYQHGLGVAKDPVEAVTWYRKALGNPSATENEKHKATERITTLGQIP